MKESLKDNLLLSIVDKLLFGLITGTVLLLGQYFISQSIERSRSELSYKQAVAAERIKSLKDTWTAIHNYGVTLTGVLRQNNKNYDVLYKVVNEFDDALPKIGIFIGEKRIEDIKSKIGGAFLYRLTVTIKNKEPQQLKKILTKFQNDWLSILNQFENDLKQFD